MSVPNLQFAKPLTCFVVLILSIFTNNVLAQDQGQNLLVLQEIQKNLQESAEKLNQKRVELDHQLKLGVTQLQALEAEQKLAETELTITFQAEGEIDRSLVSDFWIGVQVENAGTTRFVPKEAPGPELNIDGGLRILAVTEGGAADEAGLEKDDVLLLFGDKPMNSTNDLFAVIGETEDNKVDIVLIRESEFLSLQITPQPRPAETESNEATIDPTALRTIQEAYRNELNSKRLPKDYRLEIELVRGEDVKFKVTNGDDVWEANEATIDQLPESIHPFAEKIAEHCEPFVEESQDPVWGLWEHDGRARHGGNRTGWAPSEWMRRPLQNDNDDRLKSIEQQLEELKKAIKQLSSELND